MGNATVKYYSGNLLDRLAKGRTLPRPDLSPFQDAQNQVFGDRVKKHAFLQYTKLKKELKESYEDFLRRKSTFLDETFPFMKGFDQHSKLFTAFTRIGRWNPLAWLEVLTLTWLNDATLKHAPSKHSSRKNITTGLNIIAAYAFNAAAKTLNVVGTPIALAALGVLALAKGLIVGLWLLGGAAAVMLGIVMYSAYIFDKSRAPGVDVTNRNVLSFYKDAAWSMMLGVFTPVIRVFENLKKLYNERPYTAVAAGVVGLLAVLVIVIFPHVGIGALLGFKLGGLIIAPIVNALTVSATGPIGAAILTKTALLAFSVGIMDACVRGFKEIADSLNPAMPVEDAADRVYTSSCDSDSAPHSFDSEDFNKVVYESGSPLVLPSGGHRAGSSTGSKGTNADDHTPPNTPKL